MRTYKYNKTRFVIGIMLIGLICLCSAIILIFTTSSYYTRFGMSGMIVCFGIYIITSMIHDYKSSTKVNDISILISSYGKKYEISYKEIISIKYLGIRHIAFCDALVIECSNGQKIGVDFVFENYFELWNLIIENAQKNNPNVKIHDSIKKRMNRQ
ncbi:MAG: hypothetical protein IKU41_06445 [Clostridia bacterium]|nr:hypothetical protein [Clostridia bacterium]